LAKSKEQQNNKVTGTPSWRKRAAVIMVFDAIIIAFSFLFALFVRFDFRWSNISSQYIAGYRTLIIPIIICALAIMWVMRLYHSVWMYASFTEILRSMAAWLIISIAIYLISAVMHMPMPASFWFIGSLVSFLLTLSLRFGWRFLRWLKAQRHSKHAKHVMIIGAGDAGRGLIREMRGNSLIDFELRCVIDDNPGKWGRTIAGVPIVGGRDKIVEACEQYDIDQIIFAIPSARGVDRKQILEICQSTGVEVQVIPGIYQLINKTVSVASLRKIELEDLLGRDTVIVDNDDIHAFVRGKVVLVTGGGGSIGSELCRQIASFRPKQLIIFDIYENNAYEIQQELKRKYPELDLQVLIGSVRNTGRVRSIFDTYRPEVVFHAAAHKHVPLMEDSPNEAVKNNVMGTLKVAEAAMEFGTKRFVLISTDKAVNPTNVMGATKRLCEMVIQMMQRRSEADPACNTEYVAVRFGNVLGSNGSVVPLFRRQIAAGGPVTVTDPRITRFFMTIPEAVSLVLQAACYAEGGEIFVLDMGEPVKIDDMARKLIQLSGYEPDVDIEIKYTGLRPGEKLYEEKLMDEEGLKQTPNKLIYIAEPIQMDDEAFIEQLKQLDVASRGEINDIRSLISAMVPTYHPGLSGLQR